MSEVNWKIGRMEHLSSPWGNAGGVVKTVEDFERMARTGVGWIEAGSYTYEKRFGNQRHENGEFKIDPITKEPVVVYYHDPLTRETTNSLGMPNQGRDQLVTEVPEMLKIAEAYDKEVVFNIAPVTDQPALEVHLLVYSLAEAGAKRIIVNLGCPNVIGEGGMAHETLSYHPDDVGRVLKNLQPLTEKYPDLDIYVRTSPDNNIERVRNTYSQIIGSSVVRAVWLPNTWPLTPGEPSPLGVAGGGRSGDSKQLIEAADRQLKLGVNEFKDIGIDVVMSTSIRDAARLRKVMNLGAVAGAGTTFYYEAPESWQEATDRLLHGFANESAA